MSRPGGSKTKISPTNKSAGPRSINHLMRQAISLHQDQRFYDAIAVYRKIRMMCPGNADALAYFGCALLKIGRASKAIDKLIEAVAEPEEDHKGWIEFGRSQSVCHTAEPPHVHLVRPEEGLMVLFPSFFFHRTIHSGRKRTASELHSTSSRILK